MRISDIILLGLTGKAGSGKDSVGRHLAATAGFELLSFAEPLKRLCSIMYGWEFEKLDVLDYKESVSHAARDGDGFLTYPPASCPEEWLGDACKVAFGVSASALMTTSQFSAVVDVCYRAWCEDGITRRRVLQLVGTEAFRDNVSPRFWVERAGARVEEVFHRSPDRRPVGLAFTDLRFPNEGDMLRALRGFVVRIVKEGGAATEHGSHASESLLDSIPADYMLRGRHGELPKLYAQADEMVADIKKRSATC